MRGTRGRQGICATLAALAAGLLVATTAPGAKAVDPTTCPWTNDASHAVYTWVGGANDNMWGGVGSGANWTPPATWPAIPNDDRSLPMTPGHDSNEPGDVDDTFQTYVCIPAGKTVNIDANNTRFPFVRAIWVGTGSTVNIRQGAGLFVMSEDPAVESFFSANTLLNVTSSTLGGRGRLRTQGNVVITSSLTGGGASSLAVKKVVGGDQVDSGTPGTLVVGPTGRVRLPDRGVQIVYGYRVRVEGMVTLEGTGNLSANWGTRLEIAGGTFEINGDGGYYQGARPSNVNELSDFVNNGTLVKSGGSGVSVIDADYSGAGDVAVNSGSLALPDGAVHTATVAGGRTLRTGRCAPSAALEPCLPLIGGADPRGLSVTIPTGDTDGAAVSLQESEPAGGEAFDGLTQITGLRRLPLDPAIIVPRMPSVPSDSNLDTVAVGSGPGTPGLPTCLGSGTPPYQAIACVDRRGLPTSTRVVEGVLYTVIRTIADTRSRWVVLRGIKDVAAPTLYGSDAQTAKLNPGQAKPVLVKGLRCSEECRLTGVDGLLKVKVKGQVLKLKLKGKKTAAAGQTVKLALELSKGGKAKLKAANVTKGKATVLVRAKDGDGNALLMAVTIKLT